MKTLVGDGVGDASVCDSGFGVEGAIFDVDLEDASELFGGDHDSAKGGHRAPAEPSSSASGGERDLVLVAPTDDFGDFLGGFGEDDDAWLGFVDGVGVAVVSALSGGTRENLIWAQHGFERREVHWVGVYNLLRGFGQDVVVKVDRVNAASDSNVDRLDDYGEDHGEVGVALGDMDSAGISQEVCTDEDQEAESEDFDGRVFVDELGYDAAVVDHEDTADDDGGDHDPNLFDHSDGGDDGVEGEDDVDPDDAHQNLVEGCGFGFLCSFLSSFKLVVNLLYRLENEIETAAEQDEVFDGDADGFGDGFWFFARGFQERLKERECDDRVGCSNDEADSEEEKDSNAYG